MVHSDEIERPAARKRSRPARTARRRSAAAPRPAAARPAGWRARLQALVHPDGQIDPRDEDRHRARQWQALLQFAPVGLAINLLVPALTVAALFGHASPWALVAWGLAVGAVTITGLHGWNRWRRRPEATTVSREAMQRVVMLAGALGTAWGGLPLFFLSVVDRPAQFHVGLVATGILGAGGFAFASVPSAGAGFVGALTAGTAAGLWTSGLPHAPLLAVAMIGYGAYVMFGVWMHARTLKGRLVAEAGAERHREVIQLLLADYEAHASDLMWELDARGRFAHVSPRLSQALGWPAERLVGCRASLLLRPMTLSDDTLAAQRDVLMKRFAQAGAFREETLGLQTETGPRWWSVSARPLLDERGRPRGWRGVANDTTERHVAERKLRFLAHVDTLTGLMNRHQFRELLQARLREISAPIAVICMDLDGFKEINDTRGHAAGDALLATVGQRLRALERKGDLIGRLGGDEFAMLAHDIGSEQELAPLMNRVLSALAEPCHVGGRLEQVRASIGVAFAPQHGRDVDTLLAHADLAMYASKQTGGHRWRSFEGAMMSGHRRRSQLAHELRGAIERNEFWLVYQSQVAGYGTGREHICGFEALLRWRHPDHGDVPPSEFIPIAEATGLMPEIGHWVLRTACRAAAHWPPALRLSVNVSAAQLAAPGFIDRVVSATADLDPSRIELEVTESALVEDPTRASSVLQKLQELGYRMALDDFGTGYSAMSYLRRFKFDTLKIDRSFVADLEYDEEARVLVRTILTMARSLRMSTVAEGIESPAQAHALDSQGCTMMQGYLFGRPMRAQDIGPLLAQYHERVSRSALIDLS